jgi:hypothetical protein
MLYQNRACTPATPVAKLAYILSLVAAQTKQAKLQHTKEQ